MLNPKVAFWLLLGIWMQIAGMAGAESASGDWRVTEQSGTVKVIPATENSPVVSVVTGKDGHAVLVRGKDIVKVAPNTRLVLPVLGTDEKGVTRVQQPIGSTLYNIEHREDGRFEVHTPYLVSVVKGTTFNIQVTIDSTVVSLIEGKLLVSTPDGKHSVILEPGQAAIKTKQGNEILLQDQQSLSDLVPGSITILEGHDTTQLLNIQDAANLNAEVNSTVETSIPLSEINTPVSVNESTNLGVNTGTGTTINANANAGAGTGGVSAGVTGGAATGSATDPITSITPTVPDLPLP